MDTPTAQSQQDDLEIEITVAGEEFDTMSEAEAYVREQEEREAVEDVRECIVEMCGEEAPQNILEFVVPEDAEPMTFDTLVLELIENSAFNPPVADTPPKMLAGAMMSGLGKKAMNNNI